MKGYVYILKDRTGRFYVGSTSDIKRRIGQHASGHTQTTRNMDEPTMVFTQEYNSLGVARRVEKKIKALKRKDYVEKIVAEGYIRIKV